MIYHGGQDYTAMNMMSLTSVKAVFWAIVVIASAFSAYMIAANSIGPCDGPDASLLPAFTSEEQLEEFLVDMDSAADRSGAPSMIGLQELGTDASYGGSGEYFTTTNIQVAGVDEEDLVKTDGEYLYLCASQNVTVVAAYPPDQMTVISRILLSDLTTGADANQTGWIRGLYLLGDRLMIIADVYPAWRYYDAIADEVSTDPESTLPRTVVAVLDVSDPTQPKLLSTFSVSGYALTSRMVGTTIYLVTQHYVWTYDEGYVLPTTWVDDEKAELGVSDVHYDPESSDVNSYINILAVDSDSLESSCLSIIAGYASVIYMSTDHLYLTFQKWDGGVVVLDDAVAPESEETSSTTIYKIRTDGLTMETVAKGSVPGWLLNQFSMDEREPYLRVATTTAWTDPENAVYVLGEDLDPIGSLEGIAPAERIFSARFIGDTLYLVTFLQIDPLFVIDLSTPSEPRILGELEVPGFSSYLHPIGDGYLIGIGQENSTLKISLFDVSDGGDPKEIGKYIVEGSYAWSEAIWDHKAVTYDAVHGLLVIPLEVYYYDEWSYSNSSGFAVFDVSPESGIALEGMVSQTGYCQRSVVIGEYLYTVSSASVKASELATLSEVGELVFGYSYDWSWVEDGTAVDSVDGAAG